MTSEKKSRANRNNSAKSTGPRSKVGLQRSSQNSKTHSLFAREIAVGPEDRASFVAFREALGSQLGPASPLQHVAFDRILNSYRRLELANRLEMQKLISSLGPAEGLSPQEAQSGENLILTKWFAASNLDLQNAIRFLTDLQTDVATKGWLHADHWKESICNAFGPQYFDMLAKWTPTDVGSINLANMLTAKERRFGMTIPKPDHEDQEISVDPQICWQMAVKLINITRAQLTTLLEINRLGPQKGERNSGVCDLDLAGRYSTTAERGLERAVQWFQDLKDQNL